MAKEKARYFTFLLYPESIPEDWELKLETLGVPIAISPLHDKDKSDIEGQQYKKPHYHVIYIAKNPVTADSVRWKIKKLLGEKSLAMVQIALSVENTYLYLTHESKDAIAKKKHVYDKADIKLINNFDIDRYVTLDVEEKTELFNVVVSLIRAYTLQNIFDLYDFIDENGETYGLTINLVNEVIAGKTGFMKLLFDGAYQRSKRGTNSKEK
ncbi:replication protein [Streptococcus hyointestinalis]|uniref:replication protein n=1 Tax=Streptococcus hyointestinalis TaxID=1337 RepID=UPI0013DFC7C3|nr:replication protein [Streptococcus hyointestinalis]